MANEATPVTEEEALQFHANGKAGKIEITPTKPLTTQRDLSLAYSPGVAWPCLHIAKCKCSLTCCQRLLEDLESFLDIVKFHLIEQSIPLIVDNEELVESSLSVH